MAQVKVDLTITDTDTDSADWPPTYNKTFTYTAAQRSTYVVAAATTKSIWDTDTAATAAVEFAGDFDLLIINSDQDIWIELIGDLSANGADDTNIVKQSADFPFVLTADETVNGYTDADGLGSVANTNNIERVRIYNVSTTTSATVRVTMYT